jgi:HK97 gp10 family phage protein
MARKPLVGIELGMKKAATSALKRAANILLERIQENASLTDHSLSDLKNIGHPYSQRNPRNIHRPNFLIHRQSGNLLDSAGVNSVNQFRVQVGLDESIAPHVPDVIFGTSKMVGRDIVTESFREVEEDIDDIFIEEFNKGIRDGGD